MKPQIGMTDIGATGGEIDTPALLIDAAGLERNIAAMAKLCASKPGPHAKIRKSPIVAGMQFDARAVGICCAKFGEAEALAVDGMVCDVMVTTPIAGRVDSGTFTAVADYRRDGTAASF